MKLETIQTKLKRAHARIGFIGRFAFTFGDDERTGCYITHWFRPTPYAFEDCKAVGSGTVSECLAGLDSYVAEFDAKWEATVLQAAE